MCDLGPRSPWLRRTCAHFNVLRSPSLNPQDILNKSLLIFHLPWAHKLCSPQLDGGDLETSDALPCVATGVKLWVQDGACPNCHCETLTKAFNLFVPQHPWGFPGGSVVKKSTCNAGDTGDVDLIPGSGRSPGGENGSPLQYSCLENSMDKGSWWVTVPHGATKNQIQLSN